MKVLYFTSTGNSLYSAQRIGGENYSIPKLMREGRFDFEDEKIGIVVPVFYIGVPKIVAEFFNRVSLNKSGFLPRVLGNLLAVSGGGLFAEVFIHFLLPGYEIINTILLIPQTIAEFSFLIWILIRGINESKVRAC